MALSIPQGFVFKPTDQKLITLYLKPKAMGSPLPYNRILDRNLYGKNGTPWIVFSDHDPWEIVGDSEVGVLKKEIYVFTKLEKIGRRQIVRVAGLGTWAGKALPKDIKNVKGDLIGVKRSLTFKVNGGLMEQEEIIKTNGRWIMHEYTLAGSSLVGVDNTDYAVCRISWDLPKCCVREESWPTAPCIEEMTWNHVLHNQELNSEAAVSWAPEMTDEEFSRRAEEMTWSQADQELNSEASVSLQTEEIPSFIEENSEAAPCIEEMTWNHVLHNQELNSEAAVSWPPEMTDEEFSRRIEEMTWSQADQELNSEAAVSLQTEEIPSFIEENSEAAVSLQTEEIPSFIEENSEGDVSMLTEEFYNLDEESPIFEDFVRFITR